MTARANFLQHDDLPEVKELTWAEYLELAGIEPITGPMAPAQPVTHTDTERGTKQ